MSKTVILHICYYYSSKKGSEYRAAFEQNELISKIHGSKVQLITSNLEENELENKKVIIIPSLVTKQKTLYSITDIIPSSIWHLLVVFKILIKKKYKKENTLIYLSGVMPWHPYYLYTIISNKVILLGVGGGVTKKTHPKFSTKETLRILLSFINLNIGKFAEKRITSIIPRTNEAKDLWKKYYTNKTEKVIPEIINPIHKTRKTFDRSEKVKFLWIGQDVPRKNLPLGIEWYNKLKKEIINEGLFVFGPEKEYLGNDIHLEGWVQSIDYNSIGSKLVLLLSSWREGLPSACIEVIQAGGIVVTKNIGSLSNLNCKSVIITDDSLSNKNVVINSINNFFEKGYTDINEVNFFDEYKTILK